MWNSDQGYHSALKACEKSKRLGLSYIDLYLIHWPVQMKNKDTWRAMIQLLREGKTRAIGVSNYEISHLQEIIQNFGVMPSVNQIEFHPFLYQERLLEFCKNNNIQLEVYSPLTRDQRLNHHIVVCIAKKYDISQHKF